MQGVPEEPSVKSLIDEVSTWPPEEQPGEAELRELLDKRFLAQFLEVKRQYDLRWLREQDYLRDAS